MSDKALETLVRRYFAAVDGEDYPAIRATLTDDCLFTVETHGVRLQGEGEIKAMFDRLWASHTAVLHKDFVFTTAPGDNRVAVRFTVINTHHDGRETHKSNANFFEVTDGRFSRVSVYMAGENTLNTA